MSKIASDHYSFCSWVKTLSYFLLLTVTACNPNKTEIGQNFSSGVSISLSNSTLSVSSTQVATNNSTLVTLRLKDQNGVTYISNRLDITFSLEGGTSAGTLSSITNHNDGSYTATFTGVTPGTAATLHAQVDGEEIISTLPTIQVIVGNHSLSNSLVTATSETVGSSLTITATLTVKDISNTQLPAGGLTVLFSHTGGTSTGTFSAVTDNLDGTYSVTFTGITAGTATEIHATIGGAAVTSASPLVTVSVGTPSSIGVSNGLGQATTVGSTLALPFVAIVKDNHNNVINGAIVVWAVTSGGGSLGSCTPTTNSSGLSQCTLTTGTTAGSNTVTASVAGITIPATFSATGTHGLATKLLFATSPPHTLINTAFSSGPVVQILDANNNLVTTGADATASITITLTSGGGTLSGTNNMNATAGAADFIAQGMSIDLVSSHNQLTATATLNGVTRSVTSQPFNIYQALAINTPSITLPVRSEYTYTFIPSYGVPPYTFSIISGSGSINSSGVYTTGTTGTLDVVRAMDSIGNTVNSSVNLVNSLTNGSVSAQVVDPVSGERYLGGSFTGMFPYSAPNALAVNTTTGAPELSFDLQGGFNGVILSVVRDPNTGAIYVGGLFTTYRGVAANRIAKLSAYGVLDTTFHPVSSTGGFNGTVSSLSLNATGTTLYVGGNFTTYRGVADSARYIAKLSTSNGEIDTTFHPVSITGGFNSSVYSLALNATGTTLYVGGDFTSYRGVTNSARYIAKLSTSDGAIDTTFHPVSTTGGLNATVLSLALNATGTTLYAGGGFTRYRGVTNSAWRIVKLSTSNGAIDTTFHPVSTTGGLNGTVSSLALNATGTTLYVGGGFTSYRGVTDSARRIAKLSTSDGAIDTTFHPVSSTGGFNQDYHANPVTALALNATGTTLYVGGSFTTYRGVADSARSIAKLSTSDGAIDTTFHPVSSTGGFAVKLENYYHLSVNSIALDATGTTLYAGGNFLTYRGVAANGIAKLNTYGVLDTNFYPVSSTGGFNGTALSLALNATGTTLYVGGRFTTYRGVADSARGIAKLSTSDGAIDTNFHPVSATGGLNSFVSSFALNATGTTLYVGGDFTAYRGVADSALGIAKLSTSDGAIDTNFHPVSATGGFSGGYYSFIGLVSALALNATGTTLYVGGSFKTYRGVTSSAGRIAKLSTSDGEIDTNFHPVSLTGGFAGGYPVFVSSLALNATGTTLYVGGNFTTYRGVADSARYIAKLSTSNGAIDTNFHPVSLTGGFDGNFTYDISVKSLALNATETTLYAGGNFTTYRGVAGSARGIAKLSTSDGAIDTTFHPVSATGGFNMSVSSLALDEGETTLYVGGGFNAYRSSISNFAEDLDTVDGNKK